MTTLQVRDLPEEVYNQLNYLAKKEHRSLAQETIVLLKEGIEVKLGKRNRRKKLLEDFEGLKINDSKVRDQVALIREDRER
jgi:antitoxin FitA